MEKSPLLILVSGLPCTGKTTLAQKLAAHFDYPLLSKDGIKEILFDQLGEGDRSWSKRLSEATYQLMFHLMGIILGSGSSLVAEANFHPDSTRQFLRKIQVYSRLRVFEVHCITAGEILLARFIARGVSGTRHSGHLDQVVYQEMADLVSAGEDGALHLGSGYLQVDTTDFDRLDFQEISAAIDRFLTQI